MGPTFMFSTVPVCSVVSCCTRVLGIAHTAEVIETKCPEGRAFVPRIELSLSRTRVVLIYHTNQCLSNVVSMILLVEDDGVLYL